MLLTNNGYYIPYQWKEAVNTFTLKKKKKTSKESSSMLPSI